jgi:WhiB family transcriptional regulator, redox-sensing transcriptional regulator
VPSLAQEGIMTRASRIAESPGAAGPLLTAVPGDGGLLATRDPVTGEIPAWYDFAACQFIGTGIFYPPKSESVRAAKTVCAGCPVRTQCSGYAIALEWNTPDCIHGVWGGMSPNERRTEIRRLKRAAA